MKKIILSLGLALLSATAFAESTVLILKLSDGKSDTYLLNEKPVITFEGANMLITTSDLSNSYARADVKSMEFSSDDSGITLPVEHNTTYSYRDNVFSCQGHMIEVYSISGTRVASARDAVSLADLPAAPYIINVNNESIKIIKR